MAATNKRGVFSLETVLERQSDNHWSKIPEVFRYVNSLASPAGTNYGYFGAGRNPSFPAGLSSIDRVDYSSDTSTASPRGDLTDSKNFRGGTSSLTHGYIAGGYPGAVTTNNRIDYSNDTATAATKGPLSAAVQYRVATGNTSYGYWGSGRQAGPFVSSVDRLDYANDTATMSPKGPLVASHNYRMATGNLSYGYWFGGGGNAGPEISSTDRLDYANDTTTAVAKGPLSEIRYKGAATGNGDYGYIAGGMPSPYKSSIDRIDYSNDTATAASGKGPLSVGRTNLHDTATGTNDYGYFGGGYKAYARISTIDRLDYSSDTTTASVRGPMNVERGKSTAVGSRAYGFPTVNAIVPATRTEANSSPAGTNFGYAFGGTVKTGGPLNYTIQRIDFANDTATASVPSSMTNTSPSNAGNAGGFAVASLTHAYAGQSPNPSASSSIQRLDLSNDTTNASVHANMPETAYQTNGVGNSDYGYICGNDKTSTSRIDYSNDTATTSPKGDLTVERGSAGVTGTPSYGYVGSGWKSNFFTQTSKTDRIDYSNDTAVATPVGNMTFNNHNPTAAGNLNYGWFNRGGPGLNTRICRLDYSSDTTNAVNKGSLSASTYGRGATGDQSYGYFSGGFGYDPGQYTTTVCRIDYANDTPTSSTKGPLTTGVFYGRMASSKANGLPFLAPKTVDKGADGFTTSTLGPAYGYIAGGWVPAHGGKTTVDRIDFGNDTATASPKGPLANAAAGRGATGSTAYGYWGGGSTPSLVTHVDRIDYGNDTATASPKGGLSQSKKNLAGVGNNSLGYMAGGQIGGTTASAVDRISFATDTAAAAPKGNLSGPIKWNMATGNQSFGYVGSGESPGPYVTTINRINYSSDTDTTPTKGPLTLARFAGAATGNASFGYFGGGFVAPSGSNKSTVDRLDYSNDTTTAVAKGPLSSARHYLSATGDTSYGYFAGGWYSEPAIRSIVDRVDYSNDTPTASPKGPLSRSDAKLAGASARANANASVSFIPRIRWVDSASPTPAVSGGPAYGYVAHGLGTPAVPSPEVSTTNRIDYSNDTATAVVTGSQTQTGYYSKGVGNGSYGYILSDVPSNNTVASRIDYSNDSAACAPKGPLAYGAWEAGATGNASYGYHGGGYDQAASARTSKVQRLDYSSDTSTAVVKGPLYATHYRTAATGNLSYGYWGGGDNPGTSSLISRVDYASDTSTASPKGPLDFVCKEMAAVGNQTHGYWGGGETPALISKVQRLEWANDTTTASTKGPLSAANKLLTATGSDSYGYFAGGLSPWPTVVSRVDRIDYSSDTATASPKGNLTTSLYGQSSVSAQENALKNSPVPAIAAPVQPPFPYPQQLTDPNFGYWAGGNTPSLSSVVDRVDWATDTSTATTKGSLSTNLYYHGGVGSLSYAYLGGGTRPSNDYSTVIDRIDYTNDSATATPKGNLSGGKNRLTATGNISYGYFGGGFVQNPSVIDRVDYGNDTATATPKGPLNYNAWAPAATGNQSYGYFCGGMDTTNVDRVEYANDTPTASPKGKLSQKHNYAGATGNASYGYVGGGQSNDPAKYSSIDRIDYSNDTATSVLKGPLTNPTEGVAATGNTSYGWWGGGQDPTTTSKLDRLDFSNDTATASSRGILSQARYSLAAASPTANANPN